MKLFNRNKLYSYSIDDTKHHEYITVQHKNKYTVDELYDICMFIVMKLEKECPNEEYYVSDVVEELIKLGFTVPRIECAFGIRD